MDLRGELSFDPHDSPSTHLKGTSSGCRFGSVSSGALLRLLIKQLENDARLLCAIHLHKTVKLEAHFNHREMEDAPSAMRKGKFWSLELLAN